VKFASLFTATPPQIGDAVCPDCGHSIPLEDINVSKDLALCRACGKTWTFSLVNAAKELKDVSSDDPPKGVRVETDFDGATKIIYQRLSPIAIFMVIFTVFWGGGSMCAIFGSQIKSGHFNVARSLVGVPFLLGTILLCTLSTFFLFGRWEIKIHREEGSVFVGVGPLGWRRKFTGGAGAQVSLQMSSVEINNQRQEAIVVQRGEERLISFGATITNRQAKLFIAAALARAMK
jgi:hypothetical protein